jgi:predicted O-methyltransferase YrrM
VGKLLAVLTAALAPSARVLELGTGAGVGTAWMVSGLDHRSDVALVTVERDAAVAELARQGSWPDWVQLVNQDALDVLNKRGGYDLIFADAQGGKWTGLDRTIAALSPGRLLVVDDMAPQAWWNSEHTRRQELVRQTLLSHPALLTVELVQGSGVLLSARQR